MPKLLRICNYLLFYEYRNLPILYFNIIVWCMKIKKALNKEKNTPIIRKDENGLILKLIIASFNVRLLTLRKSVAS